MFELERRREPSPSNQYEWFGFRLMKTKASEKTNVRGKGRWIEEKDEGGNSRR